MSAADTLAARIDALLPQTQCRRCGFDACRPYAEALARGETLLNRCPPGGSALIVSHDLGLAARGCDRLALLAGGRLLALGSPEEVVRAPLLERAYGIEVEVVRAEDGTCGATAEPCWNLRFARFSRKPLSTLCVCTCSPAAISREAMPIG